MKRETVFVDEVTKEAMGFINNEFINSVNDVLRSNNALETIEKMSGEISVKFDSMQKTYERILRDMKDLKRDLTKTVDESQSSQLQEINSLKVAVIHMLSEIEETMDKNINALTGQIKSLEIKSDEIPAIIKKATEEIIEKNIEKVIENQNRNSGRLEEIAGKLDYLSLPFYKRIFKKKEKRETGGNNALPGTSKEDA